MRWIMLSILGAILFTGFLLVGQPKLFASEEMPVRNGPPEFTSGGDSFSLTKRYPLTPEEVALAASKNLLPANARTLLRVDAKLKHGDYRWDAEGVPAGTLNVFVDLERQMISVFRAGHEIGTAVIVYGDDKMRSPLGVFPILSKQKDYHSRSYDAPMPYAMFLTKDGVALHASPISARRATHGCIGLPESFAQLLFNAAKAGDRVQIVRSEPSLRGPLVAAPLPDLY